MFNTKWHLEPLSNQLLDSLFTTNSTNKFNHTEVYAQSKDGLITAKYKLPGYERDDIKIDTSQTPTVNNYSYRTIIVKANNSEYGAVSYSTSIPKNIDEKLTKANLKNGILTLTFVQEKIKSPLTSLKIEIG